MQLRALCGYKMARRVHFLLNVAVHVRVVLNFHTNCVYKNVTTVVNRAVNEMSHYLQHILL